MYFESDNKTKHPLSNISQKKKKLVKTNRNLLKNSIYVTPVFDKNQFSVIIPKKKNNKLTRYIYLKYLLHFVLAFSRHFKIFKIFFFVLLSYS